jgi:mono/diheme cytochrome c family protein
MMWKVFKWIGSVITGLVALIIVIAAGMFILGTFRLGKTYNVQPATVNIPNDAASYGRGAYLYASSCAGCHGDNLSGKPILDDPAIGYLPAPNLTSGQGGVGGRYGDADYVRAIRHGIGFDGRPLMVMPSKAYWFLSDEDLGSIIAYLKTAVPANNDPGEKNIKPLGRILLAAGAFGDIFAAEVLDHDAPRPAAPQRGVTREYGEYLVNTGDCASCHGTALNGSQSPEPGSPFSPNLTPAGSLADWSQDDFINTIRTGITPDGRSLDPNYMPWKEYARKTDDDLTAIFLYLQSLSVEETVSR